MTAASSHRLDGLEPDNLLAFLALLGLLRALEMTRPEWRARTYWDLRAAPLRPVLATYIPTDREDICSAALEGLTILKEALWPFSWPRSKDGSSKKTALFTTKARQRTLAMRCAWATGHYPLGTRKHLIWQLRCDLVSASGAPVNNNKSSSKTDFVVTPLKLPSGQMTFVGAQYDLLRKCSSGDIFNCLFDTWAYEYKGNSLRLSPEEARRYAYRAADPAPEGSRTELGASALASLGLLAFTICEGVPSWTMVAYKGTRAEGRIFYPIWDSNGGSGTSRHGVEAMLSAAAFDPRRQLYTCPLASIIATAQRYKLDQNQGDYGNISRAQLIPLVKN